MNPGAENNNLAAKNSIVSLALENLGFAIVHMYKITKKSNHPNVHRGKCHAASLSISTHVLKPTICIRTTPKEAASSLSSRLDRVPLSSKKIENSEELFEPHTLLCFATLWAEIEF